MEIWLEKEALWKRLGTLSNIANLGEGEREVGFFLLLWLCFLVGKGGGGGVSGGREREGEDANLAGARGM